MDRQRQRRILALKSMIWSIEDGIVWLRLSAPEDSVVLRGLASWDSGLNQDSDEHGRSYRCHGYLHTFHEDGFCGGSLVGITTRRRMHTAWGCYCLSARVAVAMRGALRQPRLGRGWACTKL